MDVTTTTAPSRTVWTGTLLHKCHPLATLSAKTATGLACAPPESLHVQQKIQFEKFAAQLLPSTIQNKSTQLSCHMQHFADGGRGFQPCVLSCEDDSSRKWSRFADFLHKDNSVGVATAEGRTLEDSKVCLFLIPALLLYPYMDAQSSESSERLFGLFSWHLPEDRAKETKQLNPMKEKIRHDEDKVNGLKNPSQRSDTLTKPQSPKSHAEIVDTHITCCPKLTEPMFKKPPSASANICKPIAATLLHEVHIEEVSSSNQLSAEDVSAIKDSASYTTGSNEEISKSKKRHDSYGLSYLTASFQKSSAIKANNRFNKARQRGSGSAKGGAQLKNNLSHVPKKGQMSGRSTAAKLPMTYKLSAVTMDKLLRTRHLQPMLKLQRVKHPPDPNKLASKPARNATATVSSQSEFRNKTNLQKSGSNSSSDKRHLHTKRRPSASSTSPLVPTPLSVPQLDALKINVVKSPDVADFHDPFDCDMMPQMSPDVSHDTVSHMSRLSMMDKHDAVSHMSRLSTMDKQDTVSHMSRLSTMDKHDTVSHMSRLSTMDKHDTVSHMSRSSTMDKHDTVSHMSRSSMMDKHDTVSHMSRSSTMDKHDTVSHMSRSSTMDKHDTVSHMSRSSTMDKHDTVSHMSNTSTMDKHDTVGQMSRSSTMDKHDTVSQMSRSSTMEKHDAVSHMPMSATIDKHDTVNRIPSTMDKRDAVSQMPRSSMMDKHDAVSHMARTSTMYKQDAVSHVSRSSTMDRHDTAGQMPRSSMMDKHDTVSHMPRSSTMDKQDAVSHMPRSLTMDKHDAVSHMPRSSTMDKHDAVTHMPRSSTMDKQDAVTHMPRSSTMDKHDAVSHMPRTSMMDKQDAVSYAPRTSMMDKQDAVSHMIRTATMDKHDVVSQSQRRATMDKHVAHTFNTNVHIKTANSGPIKSSYSTPKPTGPTRKLHTGRHDGVNVLSNDPRQLPLRQGSAVKIGVISPEINQSEYLENLICQDLQRMPYHNACNILPSKDRANKRKISYEDYVSKHTKSYPKVDSSQQTELHVTRNMGTMARLRKPHRHASVQVSTPAEAKDPVYEFQQMAMKQSVISALGALITRLRTGMTINTQITAILTLEKVIDIITKTARFDLEDKLKKEKEGDSSVFLEGGDRILTPSLPTYPLPGIIDLTIGKQPPNGGPDTSGKVSASEDSTPQMVPPPECTISKTESAAQMSTTSATSDCKAYPQKVEPTAEIAIVQDIKMDSPDSPVSSPIEDTAEKTSDGKSSQITERKVTLGSALHASEKIIPISCETNPQKVESVVQTEMVHKIKDSPDSPVASPSEHVAENTSNARSYQITERKVTVGSVPCPYQPMSTMMTDVSSLKTEGIAKLQTSQIEATKMEMHATCVKEDKMPTPPAVDQKYENANMLHSANQTITPDITIRQHRNDYMYMKQPSNNNGQPTVVGVPSLHSQESGPLEQGKLNSNRTDIISSQMGDCAPILTKHDINDQTSYRSALYKDIYPKKAGSSRDTSFDTSQREPRDTKHAYNWPTPENVVAMEKESFTIPESGLRETRDTNYNMVQVGNIPTMEDQDYRGRALDTRFLQMGGSFIQLPPNYSYSNAKGQQDTADVHQGRKMETDSKRMSQTMAGNSKSVDRTSYVPAVYTNVHAKEEQGSRGRRLDHQRSNRDTNAPVSIFQRNDAANEETTSKDRILDSSQKEIRNAQNPYTFQGNFKPVDCSSYAPAVYTNVYANEEESLRGRIFDPSQIRTRETEPPYSMVQGGNAIAIGQQDSRSRNLNLNDTRTEPPDSRFQMNFPAKEEEFPRHRSLDLSHQEMRDTQNPASMYHEGPERVIELVHHGRMTYRPEYSKVQETEPQHPGVKDATTKTFGGVYTQSTHSSYATCINNHYRPQETKNKEDKQSSYTTPNLENTFTCMPTMTVSGKPKRKVEIIHSANDQQTVSGMGSQLNTEGPVTDLRCDIGSAKTGEITSHNVEDLRNIIIQAQRLSAQKRVHEDRFEASEERTVQDATSQDLTGIKVTLRKKMPTDVKDTIAVINKCLHGSEDEERRFVMVGGQLPTRDTQAEKVHSLETFTETISSADSTKQIQQTYVDKQQSKTEATTVLQHGCVLISSDEENFSCAESCRDETRNPSKPTACIEQEMPHPQDNYKRNTHSIDATLRNSREEAEQRNSHQDENRIKSQPMNSRKLVPKYPKPWRVPRSTTPKACQRKSTQSKTTRKKSNPPPRTHKGGTARERYRGKTILEKRLDRFFAFVNSWKDGTLKGFHSLQDEAILWHKRMNGTCQSFRRIYDGKCRVGASSLRWDGQVMTMIEARLRLGQLKVANAMATYVTMSSVYEQIVKNYSKDRGRQQKRSRADLDELQRNIQKTQDTIRDVGQKYTSVVGIQEVWLTTLSEMSSACVRKSETLKGLINEMENEQQQQQQSYSASRQYSGTGTTVDYIDALKTQSDTLTDLLLNLAKLQELPLEDLQQLEQYGLPEHVLKECLQTIQGLHGREVNSLDKEGANAAGQSEFQREQSFHRAKAPQKDVHNPSQFHRDQDEEDKSYNSLGYWYSKLNIVPSDKGRKRAHQFTRNDREHNVNKTTRIRHIHKTATGELWTYHDSYENSPSGYQSQFGQHNDSHSMDRSSQNSSREMSISSDDEHHYRRGNYDQREGWKSARDWKGKNQNIVHDEDHDIPPWKRKKTGGRGMAVGVKNQNSRQDGLFTNDSSKRFAKDKEKNLISKTTNEFQENDNCMATSKETTPDNCSLKAKEAPNEVLQKYEETPHDILESEAGIVQYADKMHTDGIGIEKTHEESATVLEPLATNVPEQTSNIDVSEIKLPVGFDEKQSPSSKIQQTEMANTIMPTSNRTTQIHRPKISFTIGTGKQKIGGIIPLPRKSMTEQSDTTEVVSTDSESKLKDLNQTSDPKPIKVPGHLTTRFGNLVSLNVVSNRSSNALKDIGVKYGCGDNSDDAESSDVTDSSESGSDSSESDSVSSDAKESTPFPSHVLSDDASPSCSTPNKMLARGDHQTPLPVKGRRFLQILGNQSQRRVASAIEVPPVLSVYIDKTNYRVSMCPFGSDCRKGDSCWAAHDRSEIRKNLFKRLCIHELQDRSMWIDVNDVWRLNEFSPKLPVTGQATSLEAPK